MSSTIYNHRPLPPTAPAQPARADQLGVREQFRTPEALEIIRQDFEGISSEISSLKLQRDEYEQKVNSQISEIASFRQALFDLEERYKRQRQDYELEANRLRSELNALQQQLPPSAPSQSTNGAPPSSSALPSAPYPNDPFYSRGRDQDNDRDMLRDRDREKDRDRDRERTEKDRERDNNGREPRRKDRDRIPKSEPVDHFPSNNAAPSISKPNPPPTPVAQHHSSHQNGPPPPVPQSQTPRPGLASIAQISNSALLPYQPPLSAGSDTLVTVNNPLSDLEPDQVPSELKKEGSDWWAIFSPNVPRVLDVSLNLTLTHESVVCCVRFSADGKYLATGCNRTAQIYDTKTGAKTCILVDEAATKTGDLYIRSVCFSPDGKYLATGAEDKQIRIWDIAKRKIRNLFEGHTQEIYSLDFSRDGKRIVSGSGDKTARIWDMDTGASKVLTITEPDTIDAGVTSVAISPDGRFVAAGSLDMLVRIWDAESGALVERLKGHKDSVYSVAFSPDGRGLVSGSLDKSLKYWDITPLLRNVPKPGSGQSVVPLAQSSSVPSNSVPVPGAKKDGGGEKGSTCTVAFTGHKDYVLSVAVSPDGAWVVSGSKDRGVQFWNPKDAQTQLMLQGHKNSVISIDLSPAGGLLATGSGDWQARVWSYTTLPASSS